MKRKWLFIHSFLLVLIVGLLSITASAAPESVKLTGEIVNVRSGPGLSYSVIGSMSEGETAEVHSESDGWYEIRYNGEEGWIASWLTAAEEETKQQGGQAVATVEGLNVRSQPDLSAAVLTQMNAGEQATVIGESGDWYEISFRETRGFVAKQYMSIQEEQSDEQQAASQAASATSFEIGVDALNIRQKPDLSSKRLDTASRGEVYEVLSMQGNWVEIKLSSGKSGWVYSFYGNLSDKTPAQTKAAASGSVTILVNGTNLRSGPSTSSDVVERLDAGVKLTVTGQSDDWYSVTLEDGREAWIAGWVVSTGNDEAKEEKKQAVRKEGTLNGLSIVLDPGHGGMDGGTTGVRKTVEKDLTLKTAEILAHHLRAAGADVTLTRESDAYVDLTKRVAVSHQAGADAFISIHFDATEDTSVHGFTTYYMHSYQQELAEYVNKGIGSKISLTDRGAREGNYLVLRANRQPAILVELGFLSNMNEERVMATEQFREQAALGLYTGIIDYFDAQLEE